MYFIEVEGNKIVGKCNTVVEEDTIIPSNFIEVTEEQYNLIKVPYIVTDNKFDIQSVINSQLQESLDLDIEKLVMKSKDLLTKYLQDNPLLFLDGKHYSVTQEKQNLLNNAITVYQMKSQLGLPAELKWNSTREECSVWTLENIMILALNVASYVEPLVSYQQSIEVQIRSCITREELESIVIDYATV